jgi:glucoamylase
VPRDLPLSNGRLLVAFGRDYLVRDIYFPHVGKENHATGHAFRFGVWAEGRFAWMGSDWAPAMRYAADSLVTDVRASHAALGVSLTCTDAVDFYENVLVRHVVVHNDADRPREIRVFFHHDFHLGGNAVGDTALFDPDLRGLIHYKDDRYFLMNCMTAGVSGVGQYACGTKEVEAREGTWRDAEDGGLSGNPIAQGSVDSTMGVSLQLPAGGRGDLHYWMAAGTHYREVATIDAVVRDKGPGELLRRTRNFWRLWVAKERPVAPGLSALALDRYWQSLLLVRSQIDHDGAVLAANDSDITAFARDTYSYLWPRDGALASVALMHAGHAEAPWRFLDFCARIISPDGYLRHKYNPDGTLASSWHTHIRDGQAVLPIQEDETALAIWALWRYFTLFQGVEETAPFYRSLVTRPADFMLGYVDPATGLPRASYDLWEERWGVHTFTVAAVVAGLRAAAALSTAFGEDERAARYRGGADRMVEGLRRVLWSDRAQRFARMASVEDARPYALDLTLDASLFGLVEFDVLPPDDPQVVSTLDQVADRLRVRTEVGGLARYENDPYWQVEKQDLAKVPGNPWFVGTLWLARYRLYRSPTETALAQGRELIEWAAQRALPSGVMAEQLHPYTGAPLSVSPLTWSQAAYVRAVQEYAARAAALARSAGAGVQGPLP